jgi:hypothetical protein
MAAARSMRSNRQAAPHSEAQGLSTHASDSARGTFLSLGEPPTLLRRAMLGGRNSLNLRIGKALVAQSVAAAPAYC